MFIKDHNRIFVLKIPTKFKFVYVCGKGLSLFANTKFKKGAEVISLSGRLVKEGRQSPEAIQINTTKFIDGWDYVPEDFINHDCSPNTKLDITKRCFIAIKNISKNEEITFNYLTTEWDMKKWNTDFNCICNSKNVLDILKVLSIYPVKNECG